MSSSGLSFAGFDFDGLIEEFEASTAQTRRDSKKVLNQGARDIMRASQQMAPVDEGNLEQAHHIEEIRLNQDQLSLEISVGGEVHGRNVDEYATIMHEALKTPDGGGTLNLGPKSEAKDASNPHDRRVGGKFLERAVDLFEEELISRLAETLPGKP